MTTNPLNRSAYIGCYNTECLSDSVTSLLISQLTGCSETQNTLVLVYKNVYRDAKSLFAVLSRLLQNGLDIAGIRLAMPQLSDSPGI